MANTPGVLQSSDPLFLKLNILKIKDIYLLQISKFIFNCVNNNIITNFQNWFKLNCHVHDLIIQMLLPCLILIICTSLVHVQAFMD